MNLEVVTSSQEIESSNKQVTELRRQLQALEINVQAQLTMVGDATRIHSSSSCEQGCTCVKPWYLCVCSILRKKTWNPLWRRLNVATTNTWLSCRTRSPAWSSGWLRSEQKWSARTRSTRPFWMSSVAWSRRSRPTTACWRVANTTSCMQTELGTLKSLCFASTGI